MVFDETQDPSLFEKNDELGVDSFRHDVRYVLQGNTVKVKLERYNEKKGKYKQGDFSGIYHKEFEDDVCFVEINIMSTAPDKETMEQEGYESDGSQVFNCVAPHNLAIGNRDTIEFISDYGYNVKAGARFRIDMGDEGIYQGQYTYKMFTITRITS